MLIIVVKPGCGNPSFLSHSDWWLNCSVGALGIIVERVWNQSWHDYEKHHSPWLVTFGIWNRNCNTTDLHLHDTGYHKVGQWEFAHCKYCYTMVYIRTTPTVFDHEELAYYRFQTRPLMKALVILYCIGDFPIVFCISCLTHLSYSRSFADSQTKGHSLFVCGILFVSHI